MNAPVTQEQWAEARRLSTDAVLERITVRKALLGYQALTVSLLESVSECSVLVIEKSRRIGLTWACASYAVLRAGRAREAGGMDFMYISYSQEMTREFIDACGMWARAFGQAASEMEEYLFEDKDETGERSIQAFRIRWIVELNYPGAGIPEVYRDFSEGEDLDKKVDRDKKLVDMGYRPSSIDYINETYGGDWVETKPPEPAKPTDPNAAGDALADRLAFAERQLPPGEQAVKDLSDQLEQAGQPLIDGMIEQIRAEFREARDYDDLVERLARLSSEMGVDDLASLLEQGITLARLEGHDSVSGNG